MNETLQRALAALVEGDRDAALGELAEFRKDVRRRLVEGRLAREDAERLLARGEALMAELEEATARPAARGGREDPGEGEEMESKDPEEDPGSNRRGP